MCLHIKVHAITQVIIEDLDSAAAICLSYTGFLVNWANQSGEEKTLVWCVCEGQTNLEAPTPRMQTNSR